MNRRIEPLSLAEALRAARETRALEVGRNILAETPRLFREQFADRRAVLVTDESTMAAAGLDVAASLKAAQLPSEEPFIFPSEGLYAEHSFVEHLELSLRQHVAIPIAVGSGTINDLVKLAAHRTGRPYMCVATAASMDGYTAFGASITHEGSKQTFDCPAPAAVIADLNVIAAAPPEMTAWGYADLLAKVTAGADWILADALEVEPINPLAWNIVQGKLRPAVGNPAGVRAHKPEAIRQLMEGLLLGGFAMQATRSSRPASGAEHQFSHLWDMQHHTHNGEVPSHGLKVGIGTLAVTALYERLLKYPFEQLDVNRCCAAWPDTTSWIERAEMLFPSGDLRTVATREIAAKHISPDALREQLELLRGIWPKLRQWLRNQLIPFNDLSSMLQAANAATEPEQIGITRERLRDSYWRAFFIRRRFTVLDLAVRAGLLEPLLDDIFGPHGHWPIQKQNQTSTLVRS